MKLKKILTLMCCAVLLVCISVGATVAYLTAQDAVTNTFTVGALTITLDEAKVNANGEKLNTEDKVAAEGDTLAARVKANKYHIVPNHTYVKDPIVHFPSTNDKSYVFVKVQNDLAAYESTADGYVNIATQITNNGWAALNGVDNVFYQVVEKSDKDQDLTVFTSFTIDVDAQKVADFDKIASKQILINAYAIQFDGFENANAAWTAGNWK